MAKVVPVDEPLVAKSVSDGPVSRSRTLLAAKNKSDGRVPRSQTLQSVKCISVRTAERSRPELRRQIAEARKTKKEAEAKLAELEYDLAFGDNVSDDMSDTCTAYNYCDLHDEQACFGVQNEDLLKTSMPLAEILLLLVVLVMYLEVAPQDIPRVCNTELHQECLSHFVQTTYTSGSGEYDPSWIMPSCGSLRVMCWRSAWADMVYDYGLLGRSQDYNASKDMCECMLNGGSNVGLSGHPLPKANAWRTDADNPYFCEDLRYINIVAFGGLILGVATVMIKAFIDEETFDLDDDHTLSAEERSLNDFYELKYWRYDEENFNKRLHHFGNIHFGFGSADRSLWKHVTTERIDWKYDPDQPANPEPKFKSADLKMKLKKEAKYLDKEAKNILDTMPEDSKPRIILEKYICKVIPRISSQHFPHCRLKNTLKNMSKEEFAENVMYWSKRRTILFALWLKDRPEEKLAQVTSSWHERARVENPAMYDNDGVKHTEDEEFELLYLAWLSEIERDGGIWLQSEGENSTPFPWPTISQYPDLVCTCLEHTQHDDELALLNRATKTTREKSRCCTDAEKKDLKKQAKQLRDLVALHRAGGFILFILIIWIAWSLAICIILNEHLSVTESNQDCQYPEASLLTYVAIIAWVSFCVAMYALAMLLNIFLRGRIVNVKHELRTAGHIIPWYVVKSTFNPYAEPRKNTPRSIPEVVELQSPKSSTKGKSVA